MNPSVNFEHVTTLAAQLSSADRLRLVERIIHDLVTVPTPSTPAQRRSWSEIRGRVAYPMCGEDAQAWIARTRRESDEQREKPWRRLP